jgi:hypothetical protein
MKIAGLGAACCVPTLALPIFGDLAANCVLQIWRGPRR